MDEVSRKNAISIELLGRGGIYTINYDYAFGNDVAAGLGLATWSASTTGANVTLFIIPVYANYYFSSGASRPYLTGGLDIVTGSGALDTSTFSGTGAVAVLGGGYEYRSDGGFLFRAAPYIFVGAKLAFWIGLSFGFTF